MPNFKVELKHTHAFPIKDVLVNNVPTEKDAERIAMEWANNNVISFGNFTSINTVLSCSPVAKTYKVGIVRNVPERKEVEVNAFDSYEASNRVNEKFPDWDVAFVKEL